MGAVFVFGRLIGFFALVGTVTAVLVGVILLPELSRLAQTTYELDVDRAKTADLQGQVDANRRFLEALEEGCPVLYKRLAIHQAAQTPSNENAFGPPVHTSLPPGIIQTPRTPRPDPPDGWVLRTARKLENPSTRRGLLLLAAGVMLAAMFLFAPSSRDGADSPQR